MNYLMTKNLYLEKYNSLTVFDKINIKYFFNINFRGL